MSFLRWTLLAAGLFLFATAWAEPIQADVLNAKDGVVAAALAARQARLDWERAEALFGEAESGVQVAQIERENANEQGRSDDAAFRKLSAAEQRWRQALSALEVQGTRLARAEMRLHDAETTLTEAHGAVAPSGN